MQPHWEMDGWMDQIEKCISKTYSTFQKTTTTSTATVTFSVHTYIDTFGQAPVFCTQKKVCFSSHLSLKIGCKGSHKSGNLQSACLLLTLSSFFPSLQKKFFLFNKLEYQSYSGYLICLYGSAGSRSICLSIFILSFLTNWGVNKLWKKSFSVFPNIYVGKAVSSAVQREMKMKVLWWISSCLHCNRWDDDDDVVLLPKNRSV